MQTMSSVINFLKEYRGREIRIMEVCGTHTSSIFKNGIRSLISPQIKLISGPGCPVCVSSAQYIDSLIAYAFRENYCVLAFGDMMRVKGTHMSLTEAKARGGHVKVMYAPHSILAMAAKDPHTQYIVSAIGFETTTPIYALIVEEAIKENLKNIQLCTSLKSMIPALEFICQNENKIDGFLCPGHVSVILGYLVYEDLAARFQRPFVVAGFEGEHILIAVHEIARQIMNNECKAKNLYPSVVSGSGNQKAYGLIHQYFEVCDEYWRGIGMIAGSGLRLKREYAQFEAACDVAAPFNDLPSACRCSDVILGRINPTDCPLFGTICSPINAVGPCMVSSEGACGIWYNSGALPS